MTERGLMKRKMLIAGIIIAAMMPLFSCSKSNKTEETMDSIDAVRQQIKMESMIQ